MNKFLVLIPFIALIYLMYRCRHVITRGGYTVYFNTYRNNYNNEGDFYDWKIDRYQLFLRTIRGSDMVESVKQYHENIKSLSADAKYKMYRSLVGESIGGKVSDTIDIGALVYGNKNNININIKDFHKHTGIHLIEFNKVYKKITTINSFDAASMLYLNTNNYILYINANNIPHQCKSWTLPFSNKKDQSQSLRRMFNNKDWNGLFVSILSPGLFVEPPSEEEDAMHNVYESSRRIGMSRYDFHLYWTFPDEAHAITALVEPDPFAGLPDQSFTIDEKKDDKIIGEKTDELRGKLLLKT